MPLLTCGTVGTLLFASVSSLVNSRYGLHGALNTATFSYAVLLVVLVVAIVCSRAERLHSPAKAAV